MDLMQDQIYGSYFLKGYATTYIYTMIFQFYYSKKLITLTQTCRFKYASLHRNRGLYLLYNVGLGICQIVFLTFLTVPYTSTAYGDKNVLVDA